MAKIVQSSAGFESSVSQTPTHCIFRHGSSWLAFPATSIRQALPCPQMVAVPRTPATFVGLCHVRSEFLPVLTLEAVTGERSRTDEAILLVVDDSDGPWAVLVDEVSSLRRLEVSDAPESPFGTETSAVIGWATLGELVIQVLDPLTVRELAVRELAVFWEQAASRLTAPRVRGGGELGIREVGNGSDRDRSSR